MLRTLAIAAALSLLPAGHALARGQLQARPTLVELQPGNQAGRLVLANTGDAPVAAQVRVYAWSQAGGEDRLADTDTIAISPAIVKIPAGGEQVVRVVRLGEAPQGADETYRLVVDELPSPDTASDTAIELRLRYLVPLFVRAAGAAEPELSCHLAGTELDCRNDGGQPARLGATRMLDDNGRAIVLTEGLFGYLLPGSGRAWQLETDGLAGLGDGLQLETQVNGQAASLPVPRQP